MRCYGREEAQAAAVYIGFHAVCATGLRVARCVAFGFSSDICIASRYVIESRVNICRDLPTKCRVSQWGFVLGFCHLPLMQRSGVLPRIASNNCGANRTARRCGLHGRRSSPGGSIREWLLADSADTPGVNTGGKPAGVIFRWIGKTLRPLARADVTGWVSSSCVANFICRAAMLWHLRLLPCSTVDIEFTVGDYAEKI